MKNEKDYIKNIAEIRSMMERSSKFLSLSGWAGIMAGIYALAGTYISYTHFKFKPTDSIYQIAENTTYEYFSIIILALVVLILSIGTAIFLSHKRALKRSENIWNSTSRRLLSNISIPLTTGGILILILINKGLISFLAPISLIFYGLALFSAGNFTFKELKFLGTIQIGLGLLSFCFIEYSLFLWATGFGLFHIIYGIYIHIKHQR